MGNMGRIVKMKPKVKLEEKNNAEVQDQAT